MRKLAAILTPLLLCLHSFSAAQDKEPYYQVGGRFDVPDPVQERLNARADMIRLGINGENLDAAGLAPLSFIEAALSVADSVEEGETPGAVIYLNRPGFDNIPVGIGSRVIDPETYPAQWDTLYEIGELTGILTVTPFVLQALEQDRLRLTDTVGQFLPQFHGTPLDTITVEQLLRHSSGLKAPAPLPPEVRTREALMQWLAALSPAYPPGERVEKDALNFLLLGLILERLNEAPVQRHALDQLLKHLGMINTVTELPPIWRAQTAPGPYSLWHRRLVWGEAANPAATILGESAGHGGIITTADDLGLFSAGMLAASAGAIPDLVTTPTLQRALTPDLRLKGGRDMGLGYELGGLGEGSFGWNADNGSALWIHPDAGVFAIILSNVNHPKDRETRRVPFRHKALKLLRKSIRDLGPEVRALPDRPTLRPAGASGENRSFALRSGAKMRTFTHKARTA